MLLMNITERCQRFTGRAVFRSVGAGFGAGWISAAVMFAKLGSAYSFVVTCPRRAFLVWGFAAAGKEKKPHR